MSVVSIFLAVAFVKLIMCISIGNTVKSTFKNHFDCFVPAGFLKNIGIDRDHMLCMHSALLSIINMYAM